MPYEDDFYKISNVVGYTGNLVTRVGSLYFHDPTQSKYGRITMGHNDPKNNGRGLVEILPNYKRENLFIDMYKYENTLLPLGDITSIDRTGTRTTKVSVEDYGDGGEPHVSRGQFIKLTPKEVDLNKAQILYIISHYPDQKENKSAR